MKRFKSYATTAIGECADRILRTERSGQVMGCTSRGIFVMAASRWVLFFTGEPWHGPLTINIDSQIDSSSLQDGEPVQFNHPEVAFSAFSVLVVRQTATWQPTPIKLDSKTKPDIFLRAGQLCACMLDAKRPVRFEDILSIIADGQDDPLSKQAQIRACLSGSQTHPGLPEVNYLQRWIGLGEGLTPSGDDLITGYLLANFFLHHPMPWLQGLVDQARSQTTALSASLLACAAMGSADERLMHALGFLLEGKGNITKITEELLCYGSSSGIETLAGMVAALYFNLAG